MDLNQLNRKYMLDEVVRVSKKEGDEIVKKLDGSTIGPTDGEKKKQGFKFYSGTLKDAAQHSFSVFIFSNPRNHDKRVGAAAKILMGKIRSMYPGKYVSLHLNNR